MERAAFFNSVGGDRKYLAEVFADYFKSFIGNGVFPVPSNGLQIIANNSMILTVSAGKAWINGYYYTNTSDFSITLDNADGVLKRIDRIVVRWDLVERNIFIAVKKGAFSANPVAPTLERGAERYELALADVLINNGVIAIQQANITDQRYSAALCGIVVGVVQQIDFASLTAQFDSFLDLYSGLVNQRYSEYGAAISALQTTANNDHAAFIAALQAMESGYSADFEAWFEGVQNQLDGDIAGHLQTEIEALQDRVTELEGKLVDLPAFGAAAWMANSYLGAAYLTTTIA